MLTMAEVLNDLEAGRTDEEAKVRRVNVPSTLRGAHRPTLGGPQFLATYLVARGLGRLHPRLARNALMRLWFTPWVHASANEDILDHAGLLRPFIETIDGRQVRGLVGGEGATVVLVHGWSGRAADWRRLAADLIDAGHRVVAVDLPGHGTDDARRTNLFEMAGALSGLLRLEQPEAIVTHSMGFPTTLLALERGAPAPRRLVALAPGRSMRRALQGFAARAGLRPALVDELRQGIEGEFGVGIWDVLTVDRSLHTLELPGLVLHDTEDDEVPFEDGRTIAEAWESADLEITSGLGHRKILRDEEVRAAVVEYLS